MCCAAGIQREIEMNKKPYLVNDEPMTYGELACEAIDCDYTGNLYSSAMIAFLRDTNPPHTVVVRQWNSETNCYADEMENANV